MTRPTCALAAALALLSAPSYAQICAGPTHLGSLGGPGLGAVAWGMSADGDVIVGSSLTWPNAPLPNAFRWTAAGGMEDLGSLNGGYSEAWDVSADGSVVVGESTAGPLASLRAYRWTSAGGMQDLGTLGGFSAAYAVSADGSVVVGDSGGRAFRWTAPGGMQDLGPGSAFGVSADGSVTVGSSGDEAVLWTGSGQMQSLGIGAPSRAMDVSADGSVVVGRVGEFAFRWTASGGAQVFGQGTGPLGTRPTDVSADGRVIVGLEGLGQHGFRWTVSEGLEPLPGGVGCVSADGSVLVIGNSRQQISPLGQTYCRPTVANSSGCGGIVLADGDARLVTGSLELTASLLPRDCFGFFLTSQAQDLVVNAGGSQGHLCLGGAIGRFVGPGQVMDSGASGSFSLVVDLAALPAPTLTGTTAVQPGETWNFQCWHRDVNPAATSNFTDAVSITFR